MSENTNLSCVIRTRTTFTPTRCVRRHRPHRRHPSRAIHAKRPACLAPTIGHSDRCRRNSKRLKTPEARACTIITRAECPTACCGTDESKFRSKSTMPRTATPIWPPNKSSTKTRAHTRLHDMDSMSHAVVSCEQVQCNALNCCSQSVVHMLCSNEPLGEMYESFCTHQLLYRKCSIKLSTSMITCARLYYISRPARVGCCRRCSCLLSQSNWSTNQLSRRNKRARTCGWPNAIGFEPTNELLSPCLCSLEQSCESELVSSITCSTARATGG